MRILSFVLIVFGLFLFMSCSKCYDCEAPVQITTPDTTYISYQKQELCTADPGEIDAKEASGYRCNR